MFTPGLKFSMAIVADLFYLSMPKATSEDCCANSSFNSAYALASTREVVPHNDKAQSLFCQLH